MPLTTNAAVQGIIQWDGVTDLTPFVETADNLVVRVCTDSSYVAADLELICRWLAAFFYHVDKLRKVAVKTGQSSATYELTKGQYGFDSNVYGQMAMRLDTAGGLARLNEDAKKGKLWKRPGIIAQRHCGSRWPWWGW